MVESIWEDCAYVICKYDRATEKRNWQIPIIGNLKYRTREDTSTEKLLKDSQTLAGLISEGSFIYKASPYCWERQLCLQICGSHHKVTRHKKKQKSITQLKKKSLQKINPEIYKLLTKKKKKITVKDAQ